MIISARALERFTRKTKFLSLWDEKVYFHMSIWTAGKKLRRKNYHQKKLFKAKQAEHGRYQSQRLWTCRKSLEQNNTFVRKCHLRRLLWRLSSNKCLTVGRCIWDLPKYAPKALQDIPGTFLHSTWIIITGLFNNRFWTLWG